MGRMTELWQLAALQQGLHDLMETIESGDLEPMDPCERLDLWQYLCGVSDRLPLVERALEGERPPSVQAVPSPRAADISPRTTTSSSRARRRSSPSPALELGGSRASR
jgi:hypothetical protein